MIIEVDLRRVCDQGPAIIGGAFVRCAEHARQLGGGSLRGGRIDQRISKFTDLLRDQSQKLSASFERSLAVRIERILRKHAGTIYIRLFASSEIGFKFGPGCRIEGADCSLYPEYLGIPN